MLLKTDGTLAPSGRAYARAAPRLDAATGPAVGPWGLYVAAWTALAAGSALAYKLGVPYQLILIVLAPLTVVGIAWKPVFGVCLVSAMLPFGAAIIFPGTVTADRGVGLLFGVGAAFNMVVTRKGLRFLNPVGLGLASISLLSVLSVLWAIVPEAATAFSLTLVQLLIYAILIMSVCRRVEDICWPLRAFVAACMACFFAGLVLGVVGGEEARFAFALGGIRVNPNVQGAMFGVGVLSALYLYRREGARLWRWMCMAALLILPVAVLRTGGRKAAWFLGLVILWSLVSPRSAIRRSRMALALAGVLVLGVVAAGVARTYLLPAHVAERLVEKTGIAEAFWARYMIIVDSIRYVARHPLGAGMGCFVASIGGFRGVVHNDLFYVMSSVGPVGGLVFAAFAFSLVRMVWRMKQGLDRWFAGSVVAYYLLIGLGGTYIFDKNYWLFLSFAWLLAQFPREAVTAEAAGPSLLPFYPARGLPLVKSPRRTSLLPTAADST